MSTPTPSGTVVGGPHGRELRLTRRFRAPIAEVWALVTSAHGFERWAGGWEGDPASGRVAVALTAADGEAEPEVYRIAECAPPHRFAADTSGGGRRGHVRLELGHEAGVTTLLFAHRVGDDDLATAGPRAEYLLDRLSTVADGGDLRSVMLADYDPAMRGYYADLAEERFAD